ncbi:hypothetical protein B0J14DRAFT_581571 [Halenospora varia]|nr:hypothetical protein B0J14DRAFT_581571 [Halenospora varia]
MDLWVNLKQYCWARCLQEAVPNALVIPQQEPDPAIYKLPSEILQLIVRFLPTSSAAVFVLSSKRLLRSLGTEIFTELNKGKWQTDSLDIIVPNLLPIQQERHNFFLLLDRDVKHLIFCHHCQIIHHPDAWCPATYRSNTIAGTFTLVFPKVFWAMKCYRLGHPTGPALARLSPTIVTYTESWTHQLCHRPRIVSGTFYLRTQHWILLPKPVYPTTFCYWWLCVHEGVCTDSPSKLRDLLICRLSHYSSDVPCPMCYGLKQCERCLTEYQIDTKRLQGSGIAIVISVWQRFGACTSPFDVDWWCHFIHHPPKPPRFLPDSIRTAYEGEHFDFDVHRTRKESDAFVFKGVQGLERIGES